MDSTALSPAPQHPSIAEFRAIALFRELEDRVLARLTSIASLSTIASGERLFRQGDRVEAWYILLSGQLSLFHTAPDGTVTVVDVLQPSGQTGLQPMLAQLPALMGAEAVAPSRVAAIDGPALRAMLPEEPSLSSTLLRAEALDLRALVLQVCDLKLRTTAQRLGHYLLELAPGQTTGEATLRLPFDKRLLAARLGCRQENLSRAFATLRDLGVETRGSRVTLRDIGKLRHYAVAFDGPDML